MLLNYCFAAQKENNFNNSVAIVNLQSIVYTLELPQVKNTM